MRKILKILIIIIIMIFITDLPKQESSRVIDDWLNKFVISNDGANNDGRRIKREKNKPKKPVINKETNNTEYVNKRSKPIIRK
tara:strand:- start:88 stop:336 length:249 start_codon:yes stop_codon:yes gene_type:complete